MYSAMRCASCAVQVSRVYRSATDGNKFILSIIFFMSFARSTINRVPIALTLQQNVC